MKRRFRMTPGKIKRVHAIAAQKGLNRTFYEDNLHAVGVNSCVEMKEKHYKAFMERMERLPDARRGRA